MSNTSLVSPYAQPPSPPPPDIAENILKGLSAMVKWLRDVSDEEQVALDNLKESKRKERLARSIRGCLDGAKACCKTQISTVSLHLKDMSCLMEAAKKQGYRMVNSTSMGTISEKKIILLQDRNNQRIAIQQQLNGQLTIHASGDLRRVKSLVRQHTLDRTLEHLKSRGMEIETRFSNRGEVELIATESSDIHGDGKAEVRARINNEGQVHLDVTRVHGSRCQEITECLAEAVNGKILQDNKKDAYWRLPGNLKRVKQKI